MKTTNKMFLFTGRESCCMVREKQIVTTNRVSDIITRLFIVNINKHFKSSRGISNHKICININHGLNSCKFVSKISLLTGYGVIEPEQGYRFRLCVQRKTGLHTL
jgi:hypothetical protein